MQNVVHNRMPRRRVRRHLSAAVLLHEIYTTIRVGGTVSCGRFRLRGVEASTGLFTLKFTRKSSLLSRLLGGKGRFSCCWRCLQVDLKANHMTYVSGAGSQPLTAHCENRNILAPSRKSYLAIRNRISTSALEKTAVNVMVRRLAFS